MCNIKGRDSLLNILCVFFVASLLTVLCEESLEHEEDDSREAREYLPENWHAVESTPEGAQGWVPRDPESGPITVTKRRRLRKRKRRPPIVTYLDQNAESLEQANSNIRQPINERKESLTIQLEELPINPPRRRKRPNAGDPWDELLEESVRPHTRRKVIPIYRDQDITTKTQASLNYSPLSATLQFGPTSDSEAPQQPNSAPIFNTETDQLESDNKELSYVPPLTTTKKTPNLKQILKQNPGLSLSEILQQKNFTLSELLMGKKEAIKALTESSSIATTKAPNKVQDVNLTTEKAFNTNHLESNKYKRLPPSVALRKDTINRRYEQFDSAESLSDREMLEAQKRRQALLKGYEYKNSHLGVTRYEVITEPTTEKRIFVPSHPNLYTSVDYKPDLDEIVINTEPYLKSEIITTTTMAPTTTTTQAQPSTTKNIKPSFSKSKIALPITSAKLLKMITKKFISTTTTAKAITTEEENYPKIGDSLTPFEISIKDVFGFGSNENQPEEKVSDEPLRMNIELEDVSEIAISKTTKPTTTTTTTTTQETPKLKPFTAKDEILEILKDPQGKAGLARILEARNMTIQELIEQRERGSSQLHLADIFHNKTREPEPVEQAFEGKISSEVFSNFPVFVRQPKELLDTTENPATKVESPLLVTAFPSYKIELKKDTFVNQNSKVWQQLYPELFFSKESASTTQEALLLPSIEEVISQKVPDILLDEEIQRIDDLNQNLYASFSNKNPNNVDETSKKVLAVPSGIKSAIVASLAIIVLSMIVFVTILVVFKWSQKRKKLCYIDNLKPPLFEVKQRNIKTFVAETLGKKKVNYYQRHLQSMSDGWETDSESRKNVF
ncbi:uncharacterized protein LOC126738438 [Anthonomus grandis grandis]|uniref:uncharacterized protein LOC126738438 n=1 Tax=Anthonomus grandis grandis TaxID=2921223 RepID=UPI0021658074|nr:uncharacterized protein LOC126738438 [Anthonomus grandis grandis]